MINEELLKTLRMCDLGTEENNDKLGELKSLEDRIEDINLGDYIKTIEKIFYTNKNKLFTKGIILNNLNDIVENLNKNICMKKYIEDYIRFLKTYSKIHSLYDIKDLRQPIRSRDLHEMNGFNAWKIWTLDSDGEELNIYNKKELVTYVSRDDSVYDGSPDRMLIGDKEIEESFIFIKNKEVKLMSVNGTDNIIKAYKKLFRESENYDYAIINVLGFDRDDTMNIIHEYGKTNNNEEFINLIWVTCRLYINDIIKELRLSKKVNIEYLFKKLYRINRMNTETALRLISALNKVLKDKKLSGVERDNIRTKFLSTFEDKYVIMSEFKTNQELNKIADNLRNGQIEFNRFLDNIEWTFQEDNE